MRKGAKSRMHRTETPKPIWIKFCVVVDIADVVTYTNFGDHRLRGFWVAMGQISPSPIDSHRRPYNTLALPCECVMWLILISDRNQCQSVLPFQLTLMTFMIILPVADTSKYNL